MTGAACRGTAPRLRAAAAAKKPRVAASTDPAFELAAATRRFSAGGDDAGVPLFAASLGAPHPPRPTHAMDDVTQVDGDGFAQLALEQPATAASHRGIARSEKAFLSAETFFVPMAEPTAKRSVDQSTGGHDAWWYGTH